MSDGGWRKLRGPQKDHDSLTSVCKVRQKKFKGRHPPFIDLVNHFRVL